MFLVNKSLGEFVCYYLIDKYLFEKDGSGFHLILYEILLYINMLYIRVEARVFSQYNNFLIIYFN